MVLSGAFMLLATTSITSCMDDNDWKTDSAYDRLFSPTGMSVDASTTDAEVSWKSYPGSKYYIIEVSTDSLYGKTEEVRENSLVYGQQGEITSSPYKIDNLNSNSKYFIRVMACSDEQGNSHWNYLEKISFNTKAENILNSIPTSDRGEDFINVTWEAGMAVTHIAYAEVMGSSESGEALLGDMTTVELTAEQIANGAYTVEGLKGSTGYQITILNNGHARGTRTVTTRMELPEAQHVIRLAAGETLTQDSLIKYSNLSSITVRFTEGEVYDIIGVDPSTGEDGGLIIPSGMSITFFGAEGDVPATLNMKREVIMGGIHGYIHFVNVNLVDGGAQYLFNQGNDATAEEVLFMNTNFTNFARSIIRFKDQKAISVDNMTFDNCVVTNQGSGNYAFITLDASTYTINTLAFNNTVLNTLRHNGILMYNSGRGLAKVDQIEFNNCTLYNYIGSTRYFVDSGAKDTGPSIKITNTIFGKTFTSVLTDGVWDSKSRGIRGKAPVISNSFMTVDGLFDPNQKSTLFTGYVDYNGTSDDLFTNPANGDFSIKDRNFEPGVGAVTE